MSGGQERQVRPWRQKDEKVCVEGLERASAGKGRGIERLMGYGAERMGWYAEGRTRYAKGRWCVQAIGLENKTNQENTREAQTTNKVCNDTKQDKSRKHRMNFSGS